MNKLIVLLLLLVGSSAIAQQPNNKMKVLGKVFSAETNKPLRNASVLIKGNKKGVLTDTSGNFTIRAEKGQTITVSYAGFESQEFKVVEPTTLTVKLEIRITDNEEVVVVGYGTRKKSHLTGAISKLTTDEAIGQIPVSRLDDALKGKLAGVNVLTTDAQAGAAPTIQIRGATSITASSEPLIVIDGYPVPTDLSAIDMNDVESIEVLKDAASAAIYGSRGGNGVIMITTKSGKAGKAKFSVNVSSGLKNVYRKISFPTLPAWKEYVKSINNGLSTPEIDQAEIFNANTDAQDFIFRQVQFSNVSVGASGGTTNFKYNISANALFDNGIMLGNDFKRFGLRAAFTVKAGSKTTIDFSVNPSVTQRFDVPVSVQEAIRTLPPWMPVYHTAATAAATGMPIGSIANQREFSPVNIRYTGPDLTSATTNSPLQQLNGTTDKNTNTRVITNLGVKIDLSKVWSFKSSVGIIYSDNTRDFFQRSWAQSLPLIDGNAFARATSRAILTKTQTFDIANENLITYKKNFKKHDINVIGAFSNQYRQTNFFSAQAGNFATDDVPTLNAGVVQALTSNIENYGLTSLVSRVNYAYDNRFLASGSVRWDGSSRFGRDNQWGFFPAFSLGWNIANEKFFPDNKLVKELKLRASYGVTGNDNIGNYRSFARVESDFAALGNGITPGYQLVSFGNQNLGWERTNSTNIGIDAGLFNNKVRFSVEYFNTTTRDLLLNLPTLVSTGFPIYTTNQGKVETKGFEVELSTTLISKSNFKWNIQANGYTNMNTLLDFGGTNSQISQGDPRRANFFLSKVGQPLVQFFGYQMDSAVLLRRPSSATNFDFFPIGVQPLHTFVKDANGDKQINDSDRVVLGNPFPKFNWGFTSNFQYKNLDISITIQGSHGAKVFNLDRYYFETQFSPTGSTAINNTDLYNQQQRDFARIKTQTDFNIEDASFIAIRNLNIGYTIPSKSLKKLNLTRIRMYMSIANLWYRFANGYSSFNPEGDNGFPNDPLRKGYQRGSVPLARTITFGLNVDF
jgi:TonB-dependent starch-binding outer membrane protein SusC